MYSMALDTLGYIAVTLLFAMVFLQAYYFRHHNNNYADFLNGAARRSDIAYWVGDFGLLELTTLSMLASMYGLGLVYVAIPIYVIVQLFNLKNNSISFNIDPKSVSSDVTLKRNLIGKLVCS